MRDGRDLADGYEPLFVDLFVSENNFAAALHAGGIAGVIQDDDGQDNDNDNYDSNADEDPDDYPGISLEPLSDRGEISGVSPPENPVELPGVDPPENPVELLGLAPPENEVYDDVSPPLFPSDYDRNNEYDD